MSRWDRTVALECSAPIFAKRSGSCLKKSDGQQHACDQDFPGAGRDSVLCTLIGFPAVQGNLGAAVPHISKPMPYTTFCLLPKMGTLANQGKSNFVLL